MLTSSPEESVPGREGKPGGCHQVGKMLKEASSGQKVHGAVGGGAVLSLGPGLEMPQLIACFWLLLNCLLAFLPPATANQDVVFLCPLPLKVPWKMLLRLIYEKCFSLNLIQTLSSDFGPADWPLGLYPQHIGALLPACLGPVEARRRYQISGTPGWL